jgi:hypothetical protein
MADSTNAQDIPTGTFQLVGGYTDGDYAWSEADWKLHGDSVHVRICAVTIDMSAQVADIERGALTPADGAEFVRQKLARQEHPSLYFSESQLGAVQAALSGAGLSPYYGFSIWRANWDGVADLNGFGIAHQYQHPPYTGGHYDLSVAADYWPGVDPPLVPVVPSPQGGPVAPPPSSDSGGLSVFERDFLYTQISKLAQAAHVAIDTPPWDAPAPAPAPPPERTYTVQHGDSLSAIALQYLHDASRWPEIYAMNRAIIGDNPDLIYSGTVLRLPLQ